MWTAQCQGQLSAHLCITVTERPPLHHQWLSVCDFHSLTINLYVTMTCCSSICHLIYVVSPVADYYILAGTVYQCPDLKSVLNSRLVNTLTTHMHHIVCQFDDVDHDIPSHLHCCCYSPIVKQHMQWMSVFFHSFLHHCAFQLSALHLVDSAFDEGEQPRHMLCVVLKQVWSRVSALA